MVVVTIALAVWIFAVTFFLAWRQDRLIERVTKLEDQNEELGKVLDDHGIF